MGHLAQAKSRWVNSPGLLKLCAVCVDAAGVPANPLGCAVPPKPPVHVVK